MTLPWHLALLALGQLHGTVKAPPLSPGKCSDPAPLEGARVTLACLNPALEREATTDPAGAFHFDAPVDGFSLGCTVTATRPPYRDTSARLGRFCQTQKKGGCAQAEAELVLLGPIPGEVFTREPPSTKDCSGGCPAAPPVHHSACAPRYARCTYPVAPDCALQAQCGSEDRWSVLPLEARIGACPNVTRCPSSLPASGSPCDGARGEPLSCRYGPSRRYACAVETSCQLSQAQGWHWELQVPRGCRVQPGP